MIVDVVYHLSNIQNVQTYLQTYKISDRFIRVGFAVTAI